MPADKILEDARTLQKVCDSLDLLAKKYAPVSEALSILSGSVRNSATLLEVLVVLRMRPESRSDWANN